MAKKEEGLIMASLDQYDEIMINSNPKVLCPFELKEGMNLFSVYKSHPFKVHNRWLVLKITEEQWGNPKAFCVLLYGHRAYTPGETTKTIDLCSLPRDMEDVLMLNFWILGYQG